MKIVVLAPVHIYDDIRVFRKESVTLADAGNEVVLYARTPDDQPIVRSGVEVKPVKRRSRPGRFARGFARLFLDDAILFLFRLGQCGIISQSCCADESDHQGCQSNGHRWDCRKRAA